MKDSVGATVNYYHFVIPNRNRIKLMLYDLGFISFLPKQSSALKQLRQQLIANATSWACFRDSLSPQLWWWLSARGQDIYQADVVWLAACLLSRSRWHDRPQQILIPSYDVREQPLTTPLGATLGFGTCHHNCFRSILPSFSWLLFGSKLHSHS